MNERPTGAIETATERLRRREGFPPGFDPFASSGSYFVPNAFTRRERIVNTLLAVALLVYGTLGVFMDDLFIPGKRTDGVHLHGVAAWLMYGAIVAGVAVLLSLIIDHYDRRNNEQYYARFKRIAAMVGWSLFAAALVWHVWSAVRGG